MSSNAQLEVELDIFSGRPNPRWILSNEVVEKLRAQLKERPWVEPRDSPGTLGLGYRGFVLTNRSSDRSIPPMMRVYRSSIIIMERDRESTFRDTQGIEESLLGHARLLGYGELLERFGLPPSEQGHAEPDHDVGSS